MAGPRFLLRHALSSAFASGMSCRLRPPEQPNTQPGTKTASSRLAPLGVCLQECRGPSHPPSAGLRGQGGGARDPVYFCRSSPLWRVQGAAGDGAEGTTQAAGPPVQCPPALGCTDGGHARQGWRCPILGAVTVHTSQVLSLLEGPRREVTSGSWLLGCQDASRTWLRHAFAAGKIKLMKQAAGRGSELQGRVD